VSTATVRLRELASHVRWSAFETSTPEGRAKERHRRAALTGGAAVLAKTIAVSTSLVTIPMTLHYLGAERFGLWMTISSVVALLGFADFGIGSGVLNAVAEAHGKEDAQEIRRSVESGFTLLAAIALLGMAVFVFAYHLVDWARFFNVTSELARRESGPTMAAFVGCFALSLPLGVVQRLQLGLQEGFLSNLWQLAGSVAGLLAVILFIHSQMSLPWLILALAGAPVIAALANTLVFLGWMRPDLRPRFKLVSSTSMRKIAKIGFLFFVLQAAVAIAYSSDNFVVARMLGPEAVTRYAITAKMFSLISLGLSMFLGPLWPAYGEAIARGDVLWVKRTLVGSMAAAALLAAVAAAGLVSFGPALLRLWIRQPIVPPFLLLLGLGLWSVMEAAGISVAMFLNGANVVRPQVIIAPIFNAGCLALKICLVRRFGIVGVPWATLLSYACLTALPCLFIVPGVVSSLGKRPGVSLPAGQPGLLSSL
jgi:O-antigen/teichoic acid export membrane protein